MVRAGGEGGALAGKRFESIEGMRAWLAWTVVFGHIARYSALPYTKLGQLADYAVLGFIVISGFVIGHLRLASKEPYPAYIVRRFFRLFPAYLVCLPLGAIAGSLALAGLESVSWAHPEAVAGLRDLTYGFDRRPVIQTLLHLTLFQGVVPDSVWSRTSTMMLAPAWSLSLEWQFYLCAPFLIALLASERTRMATLCAATLAAMLFHSQVFGVYYHESFLPGAILLFVAGILIRFCIHVVPADPWVLKPVTRIAFASSIPKFLGRRSYATYLVHMPLIHLLVWRIAPRFPDQPILASGLIAVAALAGTLIASEVLYQLVEKPAIRLGAAVSRIFARRAEPRPVLL